MSKAKQFWRNSGPNMLTAQAVISPTGRIVARSYTIDKLRMGDVGLTMHWDSNATASSPVKNTACRQVKRFIIGNGKLTEYLDRRLDGMTPEQLKKVQDLIVTMYREWLKISSQEINLAKLEVAKSENSLFNPLIG